MASIEKDAILLGDGLVQIGKEGNVEGTAQTTLLAGGIDPGKVSILGVHRGTNDLASIFKYINIIRTQL